MFRGIINSSLAFRFIVLVVVVAMMAAGIVQLRGMPVDVLPEASPPYVEIQTEALGLSAAEVEQLITVPMEQDLLSGVAWLDVIRSQSVSGLSSILIFFQPGTDLHRARQMVSERLSQAAVGLPHVSKPPTMIQPLSSSSRFLIVGLSSSDVSLIEMSVLARWVIAPRLMGVPGVANVAIWGQRDRQLQVQVDPERLRAYGVSLQQVLDTSGNALWVSSLSYLEASTPGTGGFIDTPMQRIGIWHTLPIKSAQELAQVPIENAPGLRLADVAKVVEDHQPLIGDAMDKEGPGLLLVVEKLPGVNTLEVTQGVEQALDALRPGLGGIQVDANLFRPATFVETAIANLANSLLVAGVLLVIALLLLLWGWRGALISLLTIALSLLATLFVLYQRGATLNAMVLTGLAMATGVIVDDAIGDVHQIARRLRQQRQDGGNWSAASIVREASHEMRSSLGFATVIVLLVVLPLFFLEGVPGAFLQPLAYSYVLAVLVSLAVALIVTPALSLILLPGARLTRDASPLLSWMQRRYDRALSKSLQTPRLTFIVTAVVAAAGLAAWLLMGQVSWQPAFKERDLLVQWQAAPGTSRPEMVRIVARASAELRSLPGVRSVSAHVGRAVFGDQVVGINSAQLWVNIDPAADYDSTVAAVRETIAGYPGAAREVSTNLQLALHQVLSRTGGPPTAHAITVRIFGEDQAVLRSLADRVDAALSGIDGVAGVQPDLPMEEPTLHINVDMAAAQRYGIKPGDVRRTAATLLSGLQVGSLFEEQKVFDVVVWSTPETRQNVTNIREVHIDVPGGGHVRLGEVADVQVAAAPTVIRRSGVSPYLDLGLIVRGRDPSAVAADVKAALRQVQYPIEYHAEVLSGYAQQQAAWRRMLLATLVAVVGSLLLLQAACGSWRLGALTLLGLPVALAGGVLANLAFNGLVTLGALTGLCVLFTIAVRQSVLLIRHYQHLEHGTGAASGSGLILRGAGDRLGPALTTVFTLGLALLPFVLFGDVAGLEIHRPMAIVILGGLVTTAWYNLFVMPALYARFEASREPDLGLLPVAPDEVLAPEAAGGN